MKIQGTVVPLRDKVFVTDIEFGDEVTSSGLILKSDNGRGEGIKPRWGRVWAIGEDQQDVKIGEWILMEHARWTREMEHESEDGSITKIYMADLNAMMLSADEKPKDTIQRGIAAAAGGNFNFNIPG
jgi:co-chaperonin GroES (HSP10)